jgi:stage V sporulation protein G
VEITEVRVKLMDEPGERLQAFCSITFDDAFVVRDLKVIEGATGPCVAMPSRKLTAHCPQCGCKNHLRAGHCNQCGARLREQPAVKDEEGRAKLYADIAHPINSTCREMIQHRVISAFEEEKARSHLPGYVPSYDDFEGEDGPAPARSSHSRMVEPTQVQGAERPRGPHKAPSQPASANRPVRKDGFGAGIFE